MLGVHTPVEQRHSYSKDPGTLGAANQDSTVIKASAGAVFGWQVFNAVASIRYLKVYDKATGPTSADTPVKRYLIPANSTNGAGFVIQEPGGIHFSNGIAFRITTGIADNDTGAASANDVLVNCDYA